MSKETTLKGKLGDLQRLLSPLAANNAELPHLEQARVKFAELVAKAQEAADRQAFHTAAKQEASQQLQLFVAEGLRMANILRLGVKQHYGIRAEKLAEFGLQPFRGLKTKPTKKPKPQAPPAPPVETTPQATAEPDRD
jgi:hypothetical protein